MNFPNRRFSVLIDAPETAFCAAHFVAFPPPNDEKLANINNSMNRDVDERENVAPRWLGESIHGHDFHPVVRVEGPLDASGCVVDFCAAKRILCELTERWERRLFLARRAPCVDYRELETDGVFETEIRWLGAPGPRRWIFPSVDVVWIDAVAATAEIVAAVLLDDWIERLVSEKILTFKASEYRFSLCLQESPGSFAEATRGQIEF